MSTQIKPGHQARAVRDTTNVAGTVEIRQSTVVNIVTTCTDPSLFVGHLPGVQEVLKLRVDDFLFVPVYDDTTPAPLDPLKVKAGDTAEIRSGSTVVGGVVHRTEFQPRGVILWFDKISGGYWVDDADDEEPFRLTAHQPAPKPEWLFEFKGEEGPEGDEHWVRRFADRADALRSLVESAGLSELSDFDGSITLSAYPDGAS